MKKPVISLLLLLFTFVISAQISTEILPKISPIKTKSAPMVRNTKTIPVWEVTFEEETPVWTFGSIVGTKTWAVSDTTPSYGWTYEGVETSPLWIYMGSRYVHDYSVSGGNFAWIDGISDMLELQPMEVFNSYIQFDNIDLSEVDNPKLTFYQNYKVFGEANAFVDFSLDGGTTWTSMVVNEGLSQGSYGEDLYEALITQYAANEMNVSIRFRWQSTSADVAGYGYGWEIDDVKIVDCDPNDIVIEDARMNFFEYIDYHDYFTQNYFHVSSHYGQIPKAQFNSPDANMVFNVVVTNHGFDDVPTIANVKIFDPNMIEIFNNSVEGDILSYGERDTIDLLDPEFTLSDPEIGRYTVVYSVDIPGQDDILPLNNIDTTYFEVTQDVYARNLNEPNGEIGPSIFFDGGYDGEKMGTTFNFTYEEVVNSIDIFIGESTSPGSAIIVHFMEFSTEYNDWLDVTTSALINIEEEDLGSWINVHFVDPAFVDFPDGQEMTTILVAIEFYYEGGENNLFIGYDTGLNTSIWGIWWNLVESEYQWISTEEGNLGGLGIKLNMGNLGPLCPEDFSVCLTDEPYELEDLLEQGAAYSGDYVVDNVFYPNAAGVGDHMVTCSYANYSGNFIITVNPLPEQETLIVLPENGVLEPEELGSVGIQESDINTTYWVTKDDILFIEEVQGNGTTLNLGVDFTDGTYIVWSRDANSCEVSQGVITFVDNVDETKIVANLTCGLNQLLSENEALISLYKSQLNEFDEEEIFLDSTLYVNSTGTIVFDGIEAGEYYLGSELVNPGNYSAFAHVYYNEQMIFEEATPIVIEEGEIIVVNINHPSSPDMQGSNSGTGTVGNQEEGKALNPEEGKVVVLKNVDTEEILSVCVTDENGNYAFEGIPDNTNIQLFVSNFETPNWVAYNTLVTTGESLEVDFIVHQDSVYPSSLYGKVEFDHDQNSMELYPNPVSDILYFENINQNETLTIYDNQGKLVLCEILQNDRKIDVSSLNSGLYIIVYSQDGELRLSKFIKN